MDTRILRNKRPVVCHFAVQPFTPRQSASLYACLACLLLCLFFSSVTWQFILPFADAGHTSLLERRALAPLLESATETNPPQQGPWQGALALQALAALAAPTSHLRRQILSSMQQLVPAMLAASIGNEHNQQMVVAMLHVIRHKLAPFADQETEAAGSLGLNLLTATLQLTAVHSVSTC